MKIERSVVIHAPRERVWRAISNIEEFSKWFGIQTVAPALAPGGRVDMISTHEGPHKGTSFHFVIEEVVPQKRMSWRWPHKDDDSEKTTRVEFTLEDVEGGTRVTVVESGFDALSLARRAKAIQENSAGWEFQMASLQKYVSPQD